MKPDIQPYIILALPRSRTTWLSQFLSYGDWTCGHDQLRYMRSLDDVKSWLSLPYTGTVETGGAPFWRLLLKYAPNIRVVTIRRPVHEVIQSLAKVGVPNNAVTHRVMCELDRKLEQIEGRMPSVLSVRFDDLKHEASCKKIFEFCLPHSHDYLWWKHWNDTNVQINFQAMMRYVATNITAINKLSAQARQAMLTDLNTKSVDMNGVVIKEETFEDWRRDCQELFRQHCLDVGEHPDNWMNKNIPLMEKLHAAGFMQVMIARSNGKAFGYLMTIISPSLEAVDRNSSQHTTFYAAKELPGLGLKLQRAALASLKEKGVYETFMRAGVRGDGERIGSLYKRLGAEDFGRVYRVELGA